MKQPPNQVAPHRFRDFSPGKAKNHITRNAPPRLSVESVEQPWFDYAFCLACEHDSRLDWKPHNPECRLEKIRHLNDALRTGQNRDGMVVVTSSVQAFGPGFLTQARKAVADFDDFNPDNDPHGEHDFGTLSVQGEKLFFKLDYYDLSMTGHSPDPGDPAVTRRVLTIMLASDY
jgi:hypothetical protein